MKDKSNIPTGGITRRSGASTGSVRSMSKRLTVASPLAEELGGNHEKIARAAMTTMYTVTIAPRSDSTGAVCQARKSPRACSRSFSSWETSTLLGVSRKTWSATRDMLPPTA
jgi:hypothetical protein